MKGKREGGGEAKRKKGRKREREGGKGAKNKKKMMVGRDN